MLEVNNVSKAFAGSAILERVSFIVNPGDRLGIVGPNGSGKTTLLRIVVGEEAPDQGTVRRSPPDLTVGYLAQALEFDAGASVGEVMRQAVEGLQQAERALEALAERLARARGKTLERVMGEYGDALARFEAAGGYAVSHQVDAVLAGLGLDGAAQETPVAQLSGGQKTRLGLARLLLAHPQVLLLDEPTNHLDIAALEWLEGFLADYRGAALIVSHDRTFLDRTVGTILEIDPLTHRVTAYPGNYSAYAAEKRRLREAQLAAYQDQQERIGQLEASIRGLAGHAQRIERETQQDHIRRVAKGVARRSTVQRRRLQRMLESERRVDKPGQTWSMKLAFQGTPPSGKDVLVLEDLAVGYGDRPLFSGATQTLRAGERIALVGPNGSGKTTLLRTVMGQLEPLAGRLRLGAGVRVGHYSQEQEGLGGGGNALEELRQVVAWGDTEARSFLHNFLFSGDDVFIPLERLSFGERARLALAKLVAAGCNFLLLDEPINHLDIPSRERFEQGLAGFEGTVLVVAHDRTFIGRFASGLWSIEEGTLRRYVELEDLHRGQGG